MNALAPLMLGLAGGASGPGLAAIGGGLAGRTIGMAPMSLAGAAVGLLAGWTAPPGAPALLGLGLGLVLALLAAIDLAVLRLPDVLTLPLVAAGLVLAAAGRGDLRGALIGAVAGYASLAVFAALYKRLRGRSGLGLGDAKLFAAAGAWLGWTALPQVLLLACAFAFAGVAVAVLRVGRSALGQPFAFGPAICAAFLAVWLMS